MNMDDASYIKGYTGGDSDKAYEKFWIWFVYFRF